MNDIRLFVKYIVSLLLLQVLTLHLDAQGYQDHESYNVRIDPEWVKTYESGDFIWAYDVMADEAGNVYSTGYFQRNLKIAVGKWIEPTSRCFSRCPDTYFLMKHDPQGNLLWIRHGNGNSRPAKIALDPTGHIWVVGNDYGSATGYTTSGDAIVTLKKAEDAATQIFALRYNMNGELINAFMIPGTENMDVNDLRIDPKGNFYLAGSCQFRNYDRISEVRRSYVIMKCNPDFSTAWMLRGDTIGQSHIQSVCTDGDGNLFATGGFSKEIRLGNRGFSTPGYDAIAFAVKINQKGNLLWALDSLGSFRIGAGRGIVCDRKGDAYLMTTTPYSTTVLSGITGKGKLKWSHTLKGKASNYHERLLIDDQDHLILCGEGYGTTFNSMNTGSLSYKSVGGTDFYFAGYSTGGDLLWLRAGGGPGTDYCKAIALSKGKIYGFGWFGGEMAFRDTLLKSRSGYVFWLARFDHKEMERMDKILPEKASVKAEPDTLFDQELCTCTYHKEKGTVFFPSLDPLVSYSTFRSVTGWQHNDPDFRFNKLFFKNLQFSTGYQSGFYSLSVISFRQPIRFTDPSGNFGVNFTPCISSSRLYELPLTLNYENRMQRYHPGFDYEEFDHSAGSYLELFMKVNQIDEEYLEEEGWYDMALQAVNLNDLVLLNEVFGNINPDMDLRQLDWLMKPDIHAGLHGSHIGIEINNGIIRRWDLNTGRPATDSLGFPDKASILLQLNELEYSTEEGLQADISGVCASAAEITNSGILMNFSEALLLTDPEEEVEFLPFEMYPFFIQPAEATPNIDNPRESEGDVFDTALTRFTGLYLPTVGLQIPMFNSMVEATGIDFLVNNRFVTGTMYIPCEDATDFSGGPLKVKIASGNASFTVTLQELETLFNLMGIREVAFQLAEGQLLVFFRKSE